MKFHYFHIVLFFIFAFAEKGLSQGCSDPGICTIGGLNSQTTKDTVSGIDYLEADLEALLAASITREKYRFEVTGIIAKGERDTQIFGVALRAVFRMKKKMLLNLKVPILYTSGTLGSNSGLGDITLSLENTLYSGKNKRLTATIGIVAPTGNANKSDGGVVLPMAYQTTLGSFNALVGFSASYKKWGAALGYQQSFGENGNMFDPDDYLPETPLPGSQNPIVPDEMDEYRRGFAASYRLKRGNDIILRLERRFDFGKKFGMNIGVLPIYRLTKSKVTLFETEQSTVIGTDGLTLNITAGLRYLPTKNWLFRMNFGAPVVSRSVRADGLTRKYVGIISVAYKLW
ncbi:MAG: hypothetical protein ACI837_002752 [Crocinitomicaceae bacterium]|jgi:hypothetical protein